MKKADVLAISLIVILVGSVVTYVVLFNPKRAIELSPEELQQREADRILQKELQYNSTHGYVVRIEQKNFNDRFWDYKTSEYIEAWDYAYTVDLLDGTSTIFTRLHARLQLFEVGDFLYVTSTDLKLERSKR